METSSLIIAISIAIAVCAFVALVIFLCFTLVSVIRSLKRTETLIEHSNHIIEDVEGKLNAFNPLFRQMKEVFELVEKKTESIKEVSQEVEKKNNEAKRERITQAASAVEIAEWGLVGLAMAMKLWNNKKNKR